MDLDALVEPVVSLNPQLKGTLQTHGARGRVFWVRFKGDYPKRTTKLKTQRGENAGEFRANGSQSIIAGIHPVTRNPYQIVHRAKPAELEFRSIVWPPEIVNPPTLYLGGVGCTEETEETEVTEGTNDTEVISTGLLLSPIQTIEDALRVSMPSKVHENNRCLFTLARAVKALERQRGNFSPKQLKDVFDQWHTRHAAFLRPGQAKEDYMMEFFSAYRGAKFPLGSVIIPRAWKLAQEQPLPREAGQFESRKIQLLVALCRQLQIIAGKEPFFLSARTCQRLFRHESHSLAAKWLRGLIVLGILSEVKKGTGLHASRYRYLPDCAAMQQQKEKP
jgi:hypothetical protein